MKIEQIRNATIRIEYAGKNFLIDPWLAAKDTMGSFADLKAYRVPNPAKALIKMPMCALPKSTDKILAGIDMYLLTHLHPDHFDMDLATGTGGILLDKTVLIGVQNEEERLFMMKSNFQNVSLLSDNFMAFDEIKIIKTPALHGTEKACGPSCGFIFKTPGEKTLYIAGDTIWYPEIQKILETYQPDIIILNTCAAELLEFGRLIMDDNDVYEVYKICPNSTIIASHMDTVSHATLTRETLREKLAEKGISDKILLPEDGEVYQF
ncbi:MBL fold metallo-hydrolase [Pectinatus haikarae]|uniref:L-ascorbate metabolism protein UlaG (Beta-lactamase superfamily) n=1 Tax=Pectinatus haikarae TaxID=349096 RepID=A0ABT9Y989_9FIRM|nr:MBL fold metallo-hydrolase [Pectinatus haikarae]MDQ0204296.1 L-ascorbate metabolism protein UlaG (beta-lactamase superfamily) [Pectinatus haikarae]